MKRANKFLESILAPGAESQRKRRKLQLLLEELSKPEIDVSAISQHTSMMFSKMQQQNIMIIPQILKQMQKQNEPIVLEITKNEVVPENISNLQTETNTNIQAANVAEISSVPAAKASERDNAVPIAGPEEVPGIDLEQVEVASGDKQFEIIFSDLARPTDGDLNNHIIHATTGVSETTDTGRVSVPNSFPLFQIVHTGGDVPEELQHEIVRLIRQANPELDLNSITFKFKSPETVEIIANINT